MSIGRKDSPARLRLLTEGRARVALLATAAVAGGAAGAGLPALAGASSPDPACDDPARTTATVVVDGRVIDCVAEPVATTAAAPPTTTGTTTTTEATTTTEVTTTVAEPQPATTTETVTAADPPPATAADPPPATTAEPAPQADPPPPPAQATTSTATHAAPPPAPTTTTGTTTTARRPASHAERPAADGGVRREPAAAPARRTPGRTTTARPSSAATYAALPAAWTSISPIVLPAASAADFPIPPFLLPIYMAAAAQYGVPWEILAAINEIETDFGRNTSVSSAGALGWMQFIRSSWARWGTDGDGDHRRDPRNPVDAIFAAARYLRDAGGADDVPHAVFAYNHAGWYVERVVRRAREFAGLDPRIVAALTEQALEQDTRVYHARGNPFAGPDAQAPGAGQALLLSKRLLTRLVLHSRGITLSDVARGDVAAGRVTRRVLATLVFLERSGLRPTVSVFQTGHGRLTTSGNVSAHSYGHAVDIAAINGVPILGHQGPGSITAKALAKLVALQAYDRPNQIITLMTVAGHDNTLAMGDHDDHIHVGFPRLARVTTLHRRGEVRRIVAAFPGR